MLFRSIHARHLSLSFQHQAPVTSPWDSIDLAGSMTEAVQRVTAEVERRKLEWALKESAGNRTRAADLLQIGFKQLALKLREHGLDATS